MKNIKLLTTVLLISGLLAGCGMKGPLYRAPVEQVAEPDKQDISEQSTPAQEKTEQDNLDTPTSE